MLPDRVSIPGPLTCESGALPIALRGPALLGVFRGRCRGEGGGWEEGSLNMLYWATPRRLLLQWQKQIFGPINESSQETNNRGKDPDEYEMRTLQKQRIVTLGNP